MTRDIKTIYPLKKTRMHEVCGAGAHSFAFALATQCDGPLLWARAQWQTEQLNPSGFSGLFNPNNLLVASAKNDTEVLAVAEEGLRSGALHLVVMELNGALDLTAGRRLQLAAKAGKSTALALIPDGMGSNAAETRWRCSPIYDPTDSTLQCWELIKNKSETLGVWNVRWSQAARRFNVVSEVGM